VLGVGRRASILDEVAETGVPVVVTKSGKPVARVVSVLVDKASLRGSIVRERDLIAPIACAWSS
jgi:antitoxin (DNA-binding transcriptional repressor) of toxin-antitoxin stability system